MMFWTLGISRVRRVARPFLVALIAAFSISLGELASAGPEHQAGWDEAQWRQDLLEARAARAEEMVSSRTTILAGVDHVWHTGTETLYFNATTTGITHSNESAPNSRLVMTLEGESWEWQPLDTTVTAMFRGRASGAGPMGPGMLLDVLDRYALLIWSAEAGNLQLAVFDDECETVKSFKGLVHYPPDAHYRLEAHLERFEEMETVKISTNISGARDFIRYGEIRFNIDGRPQRLTAFKERLDNKRLFIPFRDETAGITTYGAGRFLNADEPEGDLLVLDFNRAVNIPCAYAPAFHCPIPPSENWLQVAVAAGEQIFPLP